MILFISVFVLIEYTTYYITLNNKFKHLSDKSNIRYICVIFFNINLNSLKNYIETQGYYKKNICLLIILGILL